MIRIKLHIDQIQAHFHVRAAGRSRLTTMAAGSGGEEGSGAALFRRWEDLSRDLAVSIFSRLGVEDLIASVPYVCKAWRDSALDPGCWRCPDFRDWVSISRRLECRRDADVDFADLLHFCVSLARGSIDSIHFPPFASEFDLLFVASSCPGLLYFSLECSVLDEDKFCEAIGKIGHLKGMAVHENLICKELLGHVNRCCSGFSELKIFADAFDEEMVSVICECLPHLRKLEVIMEKLGDRITALRQLVSPFGKTHTPSVLCEAIEYIKFLHEQVGVLSTPYLNGNPMQHQQNNNEKHKDGEGSKQDLMSRGLCLVPIASTFPVASEMPATSGLQPLEGCTGREVQVCLKMKG